ncbi:unnamed protein product [Heligmosomoides polygyrus]|uniref:COesterase domain-containing protein n=1 Tax=Heligmosomoides polygyrus TaxID=6339 RepID=A0A183GCA6_HELPZ|nr:unnamed protein product [Heligmosomoides polygyrus]
MWNANTPTSEDCLYMNIFVPGKARSGANVSIFVPRLMTVSSLLHRVTVSAGLSASFLATPYCGYVGRNRQSACEAT